MRGDCNVLYNHVAVNHKDFVKKIIAQVPDGGNYKDLPEGGVTNLLVQLILDIEIIFIINGTVVLL